VGSLDLAVEAMRRGACDFVQKPWDNERVLAAITSNDSLGFVLADVSGKGIPAAAHGESASLLPDISWSPLSS